MSAQVSGSNGLYRHRHGRQHHHPPSHRPITFAPPFVRSGMLPPLYYSSPPPRPLRTYAVPHAAPVSPTNSADEVEAANALMSLPSSFGRSNADDGRICWSFPSPPTNKIQSIYQPTVAISGPSLETHPAKIAVSPRSVDESDETVSSDTSADTASVSSSESRFLQCLPTESHQRWYAGNVSLSLPQDDDVLSPLHCFLRRYCVEAFSATAQDVATPRYGKSHGSKIVLHQVGIRCLHCKSLDIRPERAVCFPSSLRNIYHSIETWQRRHAPSCSAIPPWIKRELTRLIETSKTSAGGRRQYWEDAAKKIGLVDTPNGVRFTQPPGEVVLDTCTITSNIDDNGAHPQDSTTTMGIALVQDSDRSMVTEFLFVLMEQMETCLFTEEDRTGGRSKVKDYPVGFAGMQCKHCRGMAGFGRYFPSSLNALALANSDRNVYNHIKKCRKCPEDVRQELGRI